MTNRQLVKVGWHLGLSLLAGVEALSCDRKTVSGRLRFLWLGGCAGWHAFAALSDLEPDEDEGLDTRYRRLR